MTRKTRTIFFSILVIFFIGLASFFIAFAQGYRLDFEKRKIVKTGGFYLKTWQSEIELYLNGKGKNKTGQIFKSIFLQNIHPKTYNFLLKKEGYFSWQKNLEIKEKQVTEIKNAYLFLKIKNPKDYLASEEINNISYFSLSPNGKKIATAGKEKINNNLKNIIVVSDLTFLNPLKFSDGIQEIKKIIWSKDSKKIIIQTNSGENKNWFLINLADANPKLEYISFLKNAESLAWNPNDSQYLFLTMLKGGNLYKYDLLNKTFNVILSGIDDFEITPNNIFWLEKSGLLMKSNLLGNEKIQLSKDLIPGFFQKNNYKIFLSNLERIGIIENENTFYLFNEDKKIFEKIADGISNMEFSNSSKIYYWGIKELRVIFLENYDSQPQRKKGDQELIGKFSDNISNVMIFTKTQEHIIFKSGNQIKIAELDSRDKRNIIDLTNADGNIDYNNFDKKLYFLNDGKLYGITL